jgi:hypothetical protein
MADVEKFFRLGISQTKFLSWFYLRLMTRSLVALALILAILGIAFRGISGVILSLLAVFLGFRALQQAGGKLKVACLTVMGLGILRVTLYLLLILLAFVYGIIVEW